MTPARNEKGMALLMVLAVVALLASLMTEFAFSTLVDMRLTETFRDSTRSWYLAKGGIQAGRVILQLDTNEYDHPSELWGMGVPAYPVGEDGTVSILIEDLSGKLDVNRLVSGVNVNAVMREALTRLLDDLSNHQDFDSDLSPEELVAGLIDWIDSDDDIYTTHGTGAESDHYRRLDSPYTAKNGPLDTLDELALVRGFTPSLVRLLEPHVTTHGGAEVNINTATPEVLQAMTPNLRSQDIESIVRLREEQPFTTMAELSELLGPQNTGYLDLTTGVLQAGVKSRSFRIIAEGRVGDGTRTATAVVNDTGRNIYYLKVE